MAHADRVVQVSLIDARGRQPNLFSYPDYVDYREHAAGFEARQPEIAARRAARMQPLTALRAN